MILALILDFVFGDPTVRWHPVRVLGYTITSFEKVSRRLPCSPRVQGVFFLFMNLLAVLVPVWILYVLPHGTFTGILINGVMIYFALGGTCLAREVEQVGYALGSLGLESARERVRMLVSRDTGHMGENDVVSSAIETLAENFSDSACATLFYAALGGPVLAWLHRATNTLDAMVGYKTEEYQDFGWASARFDDLLNYLPARISAFVVALVAATAGGDTRVTLDCVRKDGASLASPNSGYPIAAFAGALGVSLCGPTWYFGELKEKPYIGIGARPNAFDLMSALSLYWNAYALASFLALGLAGVMAL